MRLIWNCAANQCCFVPEEEMTSEQPYHLKTDTETKADMFTAASNENPNLVLVCDSTTQTWLQTN